MYKSRLIYLAIVVAAFIFSQSLYESVSYMTLIIVLILPVVSIVFSLLSYPLISVKASLNDRIKRRFEKISLRISILNKSPFVSPSFKIYCTVPDSDGYSVEHVAFTLNSAFARRGSFNYECYFANRGTHNITLDSIEYYDFLKLIKVKKIISKSVSVSVCPRHLDLDIPVSAELTTHENSNISGVSVSLNNGDTMGVREYVIGDNLKNIHWKLSAKYDDIVMRSFVENVFDKAYVLVDLSAYYSDRFLSKSMTDCVVEVALSLMRIYSMKSVRYGLIVLTGKGQCEKYVISGPLGLLEAEKAVSSAPMIENTNILDMLNSIDFNMLDNCEVCIVTSFGVSDALKNVKKMFVNMKSKLNIINISDIEENDQIGMTIYTREFIEKQGKN